MTQKFDTQELCGKLDQSRGYNMNTCSGLPVWPADPRSEDIRIEDIAGALSRLCRYNGHLKNGGWIEEPSKIVDPHTARTCARHTHTGNGWWLPYEIYSVAQHSVLVEEAVLNRWRWYKGPSDKLRLAALLHDAHEYVLGDMVKPQKNLYGDREPLERRWDEAIAERFGFDVELFDHPAIKEADYRIFLTEKRDLVNCVATDFGEAKAEPYEERIVPVLPSAARKMFMDRFNELYKGE